jgi:hypothetical protein
VASLFARGAVAAVEGDEECERESAKLCERVFNYGAPVYFWQTRVLVG